MLVRNLSRNRVLGNRVERADQFGARLLGLMFRLSLGEGEGLWIEPCRSIHTHFMRFPIDVLFLDREWRVVHTISAMHPWRFSPFIGEAQVVLELAAGAAGETVAGDQLALEG